ncbi:MAG TPA: MATE family efflux transporter [Kofleriaceae bacterium]|nr:MATE family efflux transporter [Kofleriaceae bacterium]
MSAAPSQNARELRELGALALPLCVSHAGMHLMSVVDTAVLGHYRDASMAGAGIGGGVLFAIMVLGMGTVMGMDALVPQALGAGERQRARQLLATGVRLALLLSLPLAAIIGLAALLLPLTPMHDEVASEASAYLVGRLPGLVPFLVYTAQRSYLQANHVTRPIVVAMVIGNVVNLAADWILVMGDEGLVRIGLPAVGLPAMGAMGAALATSAVNLCSFVVFWVAVEKLDRGAPPPPQDPALARSIVRLGLPIGLQLVAEVGVFALTGVLAGTLGKLPAAGHQVALSLASLSFSMAIGVGAATSVRVGRAIGAGDTPMARRAGAQGIAVGALLMGTSGLFFILMPRQLAGLFTGDAAVIEVAVPLIQIAAVFQLSDAIQAVSAGALRGAGDTRFSFVANVFGHYAIGLPVAAGLGFAAGLGAAGLWWGLSLGLTAVAVVQSMRFARLTGRPIARSG